MGLKSTAFAPVRPQAAQDNSLREEPASPCGRSRKERQWLPVKRPDNQERTPNCCSFLTARSLPEPTLVCSSPTGRPCRPAAGLCRSAFLPPLSRAICLSVPSVGAQYPGCGIHHTLGTPRSRSQTRGCSSTHAPLPRPDPRQCPGLYSSSPTWARRPGAPSSLLSCLVSSVLILSSSQITSVI